MAEELSTEVVEAGKDDVLLLEEETVVT